MSETRGSGPFSLGQIDRKQSLANKCINERRRRDQENYYFEELAEIISASITDMSSSFSVKPEKCAILQETVKQIKQLKQSTTSGGDTAVQQSQVSSSKPNILAEDFLGPLLLEALDGFLFVVNCQGKVEFVSDNVTQFLKYTQDDLIGKSVYNIIHVGDHAQFSNSLLPMSVSSGINWTENLSGKGKTFNCRLLIKPPCDDDDLEAKQTYVSQYETMQISSSLHPDSFTDNAETSDSNNPSLVCVARRLPLAEKTKAMLGVEQFTTKQDLNGKIIGCDISGIAAGRFNLPDFVGQNIQDFCHANDVQQISKHLQEVVNHGHNTSAVYRFKLQEKRYVFVQTKSSLFQNRVNGTAEFIMSVHSIVRECDTEDEKGSASTSLMKAIIGPSINQNQSKVGTAISSVNTSIANMALVGNAMLSQMTSGNFHSLNDNLSDELLRETSAWDSQLSDSNLSGFDTENNNNNVNFNFQNASISSTPTSFSSPSWTNSSMSNLELSKVQQLQRSLSTSSALQNPTSATIAATMAAVVSKRPMSLSQYPQRSSSLDHGHGQNIGQGQRSPGYSQSPGPRSGGFQLPNQRGPPSFNRRSPAASPNPHGQGNFNAPFPRTPSPMLSPSPGLNNSSWGHQPMISQTGSSLHLSHQTGFENQSGMSAQDRLYQQINGLENLVGGDKKVNRSGKLCQLLTQHSPPTSSQKSAPGTPKSARSRHNSRQGIMEMSPMDSRQSPQPGPGTSPPEKPQSTSNDDGEHVVHTESKDANRLLKTLLSQPDEEYEEPFRHEIKKEESAEAQAVQQKEANSVEMEKNEAEAKKPNNILLKQLLSTDDDAYFKEAKKEGLTQIENSSMIPKLMDDSKKDNCRSAPAESTSADLDHRQRHRSEPQEPQSTTSHSLPMPPLSSPLNSPTAPSFSLSQSNVDTSLLKGMFNVSANTSVNLQLSGANNLFSGGSISNAVFTSGTNVSTNRLLSVSSSSDMSVNPSSKDKSIDKLLHMLWEGENGSSEERETVKSHLDNLKRKHDLIEAVSDSENLTLQSSATTTTSSKLSRENALLSQLLSKRSGDEVEFVVSTRSIQPSGVPQSRYPPNLASKLLKVNPSSASLSAQDNTKRQRTNDGVPGPSTLERALISAQKMDSLLPSSSPVDPGSSGFSQNSNSGFSNISSDISSSQFKEQYSELQNMLKSVSEDSSVATEVNLDDNTDHVLAQILQQADDLERDVLWNRSLSGSNNAAGNQSSQKSSQDSGNSLVSAQNSGLVPDMVNRNFNQSNTGSTPLGTTSTPPVDIIKQLWDESIDIDSLLGSSNSLMGTNDSKMDMNDQLAIDAIQKQLMTELPGQSISGTSPTNGSMPPLQNNMNRQRILQVGLTDQQGPMTGPPMQQATGMMGNQTGQLTGMNGQFGQNSVRQALSSQVRGLQQPGYVPNPHSQSFPSQGPRLPHPQGPLGSALPSPTQRPMFPNPNPNSSAQQVRQSLLQQQRLKQMRERDKQRLQQQDRQKMLQQQRPFGSQQFPGQRFPPDNLAMGSGGGIVPFPENLAELMNSGSAPNVTLQRNQIPGPMSPRFAQGLQQPPQSPNMGSLMPPSSQVSPNFSPSQQQQQQQQQQQWNMRQGQSNMSLTNQTQAQYNRHRSLSGGTMQTNPQRFPLSDSQFAGTQPMAGMFGSQQQLQQQQMFQQNRGNQLQRQMSMPGRGSPRASQSPFPSSDPLLMSPHNISPNSMRGNGSQQQISPSYSQPGGMSSGYGQSSITSPTSSITPPQYSQNQRLMDIDLSSLFDNSKKPPDVPLSVNTPASNHFVKREIRNLCNARTDRHLKTQMLPPQLSPQYVHQQQPQPMDQESSELPLDILEQINEMSQEHGTSLQTQDYKEELVLPKKREEAKSRYETLQALASSSDKDEKATNLFRKQLSQQQQKLRLAASAEKLGGNFVEPKHVNVVQNEPRVPVEEIKPANQKDSLLQQLLSD